MVIAQEGKKQLNFELNLLPIISVLAVCVCFLLMTAVWIPIGQVSIQQGLGETPLGQTENPPTVFAAMNANGEIVFMLKDLGPQQTREERVVVNGIAKQINWAAVQESLQSIRKTYPQIRTAIVMPNPISKYDDVIQMMDHMHRVEIADVGLSPF